MEDSQKILEQLAELIKSVNSTNDRMSKLESKFDLKMSSVELRLKGIDNRLSGFDSRLDIISEQLQIINERLANLEKWVPVENSNLVP